MIFSAKPLLACAAALLLAGAGCSRPPPAQTQPFFQARLEEWTRDILADDPELASRAGASEAAAGGPYSARLTDRGLEAMERRRTAAVRRLAELRAIDPAALGPREAAFYATAAAQIESAAAAAAYAFGDFSPLGGARPYAMSPMNAAFLALPSFLEERQPLGSFAQAQDYLARLDAVADAVQQEALRLEADARAGVIPPDFILRATLQLLEGLTASGLDANPYLTAFNRKLDVFIPPAAPTAPQTPEQAEAARLRAEAERIVVERILPAHRDAAQSVRSLLPQATPQAGVWRLPDGEAYYRTLLQIETSTALTPDEIHAIGRARVRELTSQLDVALRRMGLTAGSVGERMALVSADPAHQYPNTPEGRDALLADVRARVERVRALAPRWFSTQPRAGLEVRPVPTFAEAGAPGAYYAPPSLDGTQPGIYYINLRDPSEMTRIDLPTQDYHEAVPGHHMQIALAQERTDAPLLMRLMGFTAFTEGWALYAEQLADEQSLYADDPIGRLGYLRWQMWRAARLVVDTGLHAKRWSREEAVNYLIEVTGDARGVIETEVDRYVALPGQAASYELGRRAIVQQREIARRALGPLFDLRAFHDAVLRDGEAPLSVLEVRLQAWRSEVRESGESR